MATLQSAINHLNHNGTAYWWLYSGTRKVGQYNRSSDMSDSIQHLKQSVELLPPGKYDLTSATKEADKRGAVYTSFTTTDDNQTVSMNTAQNNPYGISDSTLKQIEDNARKNLLFEQMADKFGPAIDLLKDLERRVTKLEKDWEDEDGDGVPNFLEIAKKGMDTVKAGTDIAGTLKGMRMTL